MTAAAMQRVWRDRLRAFGPRYGELSWWSAKFSSSVGVAGAGAAPFPNEQKKPVAGSPVVYASRPNTRLKIVPTCLV